MPNCPSKPEARQARNERDERKHFDAGGPPPPPLERQSPLRKVPLPNQKPKFR